MCKYKNKKNKFYIKKIKRRKTQNKEIILILKKKNFGCISVYEKKFKLESLILFIL